MEVSQSNFQRAMINLTIPAINKVENPAAVLQNDAENISPTFATAATIAIATAITTAHGLKNFASATAGARILFATDEWFATADNLLKDRPPIFDPSLYCGEGKVMDGWESRRRREAGHDWCLISLSHRATIVGIEIDTAHFTGNNVPLISIEVADFSPSHVTNLVRNLPGSVERLLYGGQQGTGCTPEEVSVAERVCRKDIEWSELLSMTALRPGFEESRMHYYITTGNDRVGTHLRVNYFPDGGVARLRIWGIDAPATIRMKNPIYLPITTGKICTVILHSSTDEPPSRKEYKDPEISCQTFGGEGMGCSNKHYGEPCQLIQPTMGKDMSDGWETARHPSRSSILVKNIATGLVDSPLMDWAILKLGKLGTNSVARIIVDTKHFRGNYPESVLVEGCFVRHDESISNEDIWFTLVPRTRMAPDSEHVFERDLDQLENFNRAVNHLRVSIFPDGGLSRVRLYGQPLRVDNPIAANEKC